MEWNGWNGMDQHGMDDLTHYPSNHSQGLHGEYSLSPGRRDPVLYIVIRTSLSNILLADLSFVIIPWQYALVLQVLDMLTGNALSIDFLYFTLSVFFQQDLLHLK